MDSLDIERLMFQSTSATKVLRGAVGANSVSSEFFGLGKYSVNRNFPMLNIETIPLPVNTLPGNLAKNKHNGRYVNELHTLGRPVLPCHTLNNIIFSDNMVAAGFIFAEYCSHLFGDEFAHFFHWCVKFHNRVLLFHY